MQNSRQCGLEAQSFLNMTQDAEGRLREIEHEEGRFRGAVRPEGLLKLPSCSKHAGLTVFPTSDYVLGKSSAMFVSLRFS